MKILANSSEPYFDSVSKDWDQIGNSFFGEAPRNAIFSKVAISDKTVLADIGCGTGYLTEGAADSNATVIAIDQSEKMVKLITEKFALYPQIEGKVGKAESLPIETESCDYVVANMYLHHVEDPKKAVREMVRILKPGGELIFTDLDTHEFEFLVKEQHDRWMGFERKNIKNWMQSAGLCNVEVEGVGSNCCAEAACSGAIADISIFIASGKKNTL